MNGYIDTAVLLLIKTNNTHTHTTHTSRSAATVHVTNAPGCSGRQTKLGHIKSRPGGRWPYVS